MPRRPQPLRIAIDTGGTFTDCVWRDAGRVRMLKVFSTPADPSQAIVEALRQIAKETAHDGELVLLHGTTVGTNTLLQRKGARTALVTTAGFEDAIEIGRQARPKLYDFFFDRIGPLVPTDLRFGVDERTASDGEIRTAPDPEKLRVLAQQIGQANPQSIAISFLFSFANPANEQSVADALKTLDLPLSISHEILPEFREYERTSTVVINAYLQPVMQSYLENLGTCRAERRFSAKISGGGRAALERREKCPGKKWGFSPRSAHFRHAIQRRHYRTRHRRPRTRAHRALRTRRRRGRRSCYGPRQRLRPHHRLRHGRHVNRRLSG